jgi:hypothetical protein
MIWVLGYFERGEPARSELPSVKYQIMKYRLPAALFAALALVLTVISPAQAYVRIAGATPSKCLTGGEGFVPVTSSAGNAYMMEQNEYNSTAAEKVCTTGSPEVQVVSSSISIPLGGSPGAYTAVFRGCHWGLCTTKSGLPLALTDLDAHPWAVHLSETTTVPHGGIWDDSYDIFYTPSATGTQRGQDLEMMIFMQLRGPFHPAGDLVASNVKIGAWTYNVYWSGHTLTFMFTKARWKTNGLSLGNLSAYAVAHRYMPSSWHLIDVESGFELWTGGAGANLDKLSICTPTGC